MVPQYLVLRAARDLRCQTEQILGSISQCMTWKRLRCALCHSQEDHSSMQSSPRQQTPQPLLLLCLAECHKSEIASGWLTRLHIVDNGNCPSATESSRAASSKEDFLTKQMTSGLISSLRLETCQKGARIAGLYLQVSRSEEFTA